MPLFNTSDSSNSSGGCGIPILDPEEVGRQLNLDPKVIDWLKKEPVNDEIPILVLSYQQAFFNLGNFDANKKTVSNALVTLGAILVSDNVFKFNDWPTLYAARDHMLLNMDWCFYHPNHALAQRFAISNQPTIQTTAITSLSENTGKLTIQPYEFFKL